MQPTHRPWPNWPGWAKRGEVYEAGPRLTLTLEGLRNLHDLNINWARLRPDVAFTPNQIRHLISFDSQRRGGGLVLATLPPHWRFPYHDPSGGAWNIPDLPPPPPPPPRPRDPWPPSGRLVAALVLFTTVALILLRAGEKCYNKRLCSRRRRRSEEWPSPSVLATQHHLTQIDDIESFPSTSDLPPPYSECTPANKPHEEPPPPYSVLYSAVEPSVHLTRHADKVMNSRLTVRFNPAEAHTSTANKTEEDSKEDNDNGNKEINNVEGRSGITDVAIRINEEDERNRVEVV